MLAMHVGAVFALLPRFWSWQAVVAFAVLYWVTVIGVTLGLHRLVAHRSFEAPRWLERLLVVMGTLACQSSPIEWVGLHRHHHKFSDQPNDHHDAGRGLWWAHSEWMLHKIPALDHLEMRALNKDVGDKGRPRVPLADAAVTYVSKHRLFGQSVARGLARAATLPFTHSPSSRNLAAESAFDPHKSKSGIHGTPSAQSAPSNCGDVGERAAAHLCLRFGHKRPG